uniref:Uncharacterized protein n=1 Tax=candidate division WOR-3 bacterium TaxID=2052148 RepID=A0A7C4TCE9_UNCW3
MKYLGALALLPMIAFTANCFIWDYPDTDYIYDPEAGMTIDDTYWLRQALTTLGHTFVMDTMLPSNITPYQVFFAMCGWYDC